MMNEAPAMMETQRTPVPNSVFYSKIKPQGYATKTSAYRFQPTGFIANNIGNSDIVRFIISMSTGYWDPYSAYCNLIIDVSSNPTMVGNAAIPGAAVQIDNSAQSFFSSLIIYKDGKELERIMEYDTIAAVLYDINSSPTTKFQREQEGCGGMVTGNYDTFEKATFPLSNGLANNVQGTINAAANVGPMSVVGFNPRVPPYIYGSQTQNVQSGSTTVNSFNNFYSTGDTINGRNAYFPGGQQSCVGSLLLSDYSLSSQSPYGYPIPSPTANISGNMPENGNLDLAYTNLISEYSINGTSMVQGPLYENFSTTKGLAGPANETVNSVGALMWKYDVLPEQGFTTLGGYGTNVSPSTYNNSAGTTILGPGFTKPFVQNFCGTCMEARFTNANFQNAIVNGVISVISNVQNQFCFPLMSGLLGNLIPEQNYKLLPMSALRELILEFRMSPYAVFTSNAFVSRAYRVTKFEIVAEIVDLDPVTTMAVEMQIDGEGFYFQSVSWFLGPTYNIQNNNIPGQIQVNLGFDSLKTIVFTFLAGDYTDSNAARKQYRLSHNLTSLQLQIGSKYYPQQPITGQSGTNCGYNNGTLQNVAGNNAEFYIQTLRAFNLLHRMDSPHIYGIGNTAVNYRLWDPTSVAFNGGQYLGGPGPSAFIPATAAGTQAWTSDINYFFENSCVGKCVYGFDLEAFNYEDVIGGVNTNIERSPFTINLTYSAPIITANGQTTNTAWLRNSTCYVFCLYDLLVRINRFGVETMGRA